MFDLIRNIWRTKTITKTELFTEAPKRFRGNPTFTSNECTGCQICAASCPSGAIAFQQDDESITLSLSYARCIFCGVCTEVCETATIQMTNEYRLATKHENELTVTSQQIKLAKLLTAGKEV
ncbi:4Fe-4S binding protein [Geobacillus subterraneus]|uniref:4Fe-4S binding protein n=1 Tax=Geobacillus subterraneus TaxID=129338 RepID=UPI0016220603